jgi:hypothetical protein
MMFGRLVEARQKVGSQPLGKIEHGDHGKQKTRKSPGKQKSQPRVGHGPLPHLLSENPLHHTMADGERIDLEQYHNAKARAARVGLRVQEAISGLFDQSAMVGKEARLKSQDRA